jgi:hypothetical protein
MGVFRIVRRFKHCERCETQVGPMAPNRHLSSETVKNALLWGFGVFVPVMVMLVILWWD